MRENENKNGGYIQIDKESESFSVLLLSLLKI